MDVNFPEYSSKFHRDEQVKLQIPQQKLGDEAFPRNETSSWQYNPTIQPNRPLQAKCCQKMICTLIKIVIFSDTILMSVLPKYWSKFFISVDIGVTEHQNEESLFQSIDSNDSAAHFIIIKSAHHVKRLINRAHSYDNVHSIYLQCEQSELKCQRRQARNYSKLDAVYDEPLQLLIKLIMDIALFCEETADRQRDEMSSLQAAHRNYQRSMDLYAFVESLV